MTAEEKIFPQNEPDALPGEPEVLPDDSETWSNEPETLDSAAGSPTATQARPWRYFIAGMGLALLAVALGAVLGYLARPTLELAAFVAAIPTTPAEAVISLAGTPAIAPPTAQAAPNLITDIVQAGGHSKGAADAPVIMVEYSDFQCPFCTRHTQEVAPRLEEAYLKSGQMRLIYKHFTVKGPDSVSAAMAAECAAEQDKFWEYHDLLFARTGQVAFNAENLKAFAAELKLDTAAFSQCFDSQKYLQTVQVNSAEAQQLGIRGTPGFFVNDTPIAGAQPFEVFQQAIEAELAQAGVKDGAAAPAAGASAGTAVTTSTVVGANTGAGAVASSAVNASAGAAEPIEEQWDVEIGQIRGLGFSADGRQLVVAAADGFRIFTDGQWLTPELPRHDYLGYAVTDDGFYSSGYPDPAANLVNPFGLVKSADGGKTLTPLAFEGESDFSLMGVGYHNHAIYVFNGVPNSKLTLGVHYSLDDGQTWQESALRGIRSRTAQIAVHPTEANRVAIATEGGLFLSADYGDTFELINEDDPVIAAEFDPGGTLLFFGYGNLSTYDLANKKISSLTTPAIAAQDAIAYIAVSPAKFDEIVLATFLGDLHLSQDGGQSWQQLLQAGKGKSAR
jgi:protein-disulfide isomerase